MHDRGLGVAAGAVAVDEQHEGLAAGRDLHRTERRRLAHRLAARDLGSLEPDARAIAGGGAQLGAVETLERRA